jgi:hypothetical protein
MEMNIKEFSDAASQIDFSDATKWPSFLTTMVSPAKLFENSAYVQYKKRDSMFRKSSKESNEISLWIFKTGLRGETKKLGLFSRAKKKTRLLDRT